MADTYNKALKTIIIALLGGHSSVRIADTVDNPSATRAIGQFLKRETMVMEMTNPNTGEVATVEVPFHAVDSIRVSESQSNTIKIIDPYGCELDDGDNDDGDNDDGGSGDGGKK